MFSLLGVGGIKIGPEKWEAGQVLRAVKDQKAKKKEKRKTKIHPPIQNREGGGEEERFIDWKRNSNTKKREKGSGLFIGLW